MCAENRDGLPELKMEIIKILDSLEKPFYAFNADFERGVLFNHINKKIEFEGELNFERFESKRWVVQLLKIRNYGDPFNNNGLLCSQDWLKGKIENAVLHNRSCLLKERDILLKRGFRKPDDLRFIA